MSVINITKDNYEKEVLQSDKPVLLDFWAPWCGPCQMVGPIIDSIADEVDYAKVGKVNVDEQQDLARKYGVMSIPTLLVIEDGKVVENAVGANSKERILQMINK